MELLNKLDKTIVTDHYIDDIYYDGGYIAIDFTLFTNIGQFSIKNLFYCDALEPELLLASYRPGFGHILTTMIVKKYDGHPITFTPL